jgi:hypothetical protein
MVSRLLKPLDPVGRAHEPEPLILENRSDDFRDEGVVVDHQDLFPGFAAHRPISSARIPKNRAISSGVL